jgi:hypothetical protein
MVSFRLTGTGFITTAHCVVLRIRARQCAIVVGFVGVTDMASQLRT